MPDLIHVLDPTMPAPRLSRGLAPRVDTVNGKTVGLRVRWTRFEAFMDRFHELLQERYSPASVAWSNEELTRTRKGAKGSPGAETFFNSAECAVLGLAA